MPARPPVQGRLERELISLRSDGGAGVRVELRIGAQVHGEAVLSVLPKNKMGDLFRALGQGEEARQAFGKSLAIRERLAPAEPDRADYQRDLSCRASGCPKTNRPRHARG